MDPCGDRVGLLVIRVWVEAGSEIEAGVGSKRMRARLTAIGDLAERGVEPEIVAAAGIDDVCDQVRRWLTGFLVARDAEAAPDRRGFRPDG
jgi:hypothetical protein